MKKVLIFFFFVLAVGLIIFALQGNFTNTTPSPDITPTVSLPPVAEPSATPEPEEPVHTSDPRNQEPVIRAEIAKLLRDAQELIDEDLTDDASMILKDLRTRNLTDAEKSQVDALQTKLASISK